jgi:hypothetical protein
MIGDWKYHEEREAHTMEGRISNSVGSIATFCSCGLAFMGRNVAQADNRWMAHARAFRENPEGLNYTNVEYNPT